MKLKYKLTTDEYNALDDATKAHYVDKGGRYELDLDENPALTALQAERTAKQAAENELRVFKATGVTPEELTGYVTFKAKHGTLESVEQVLEQGDAAWKTERQRLVEEHTRQMTEKDKAVKQKDEVIGQKESEIDSYVKTREISDALTEHGVKAGSRDILCHYLTSRVVTVQDNGRRVIRVLDESGQHAFADGAGNYKTVADHVKELSSSEKYADFFEPTGRGGSGAPGRSGGNPTRGQGRISRTDQRAINANLEAIASGKVVVVE